MKYLLRVQTRQNDERAIPINGDPKFGYFKVIEEYANSQEDASLKALNQGFIVISFLS